MKTTQDNFLVPESPAVHAAGVAHESAPPAAPGPVSLPSPASITAAAQPPALQDGDYYLEGGRMVFTAAYHLRRGYCCGNRCRHCPYQDWKT